MKSWIVLILVALTFTASWAEPETHWFRARGRVLAEEPDKVKPVTIWVRIAAADKQSAFFAKSNIRHWLRFESSVRIFPHSAQSFGEALLSVSEELVDQDKVWINLVIVRLGNKFAVVSNIRRSSESFPAPSP